MTSRGCEVDYYVDNLELSSEEFSLSIQNLTYKVNCYSNNNMTNLGNAGFLHLSLALGIRNKFNGFSSLGSSCINDFLQVPKCPFIFKFEYFIKDEITSSHA